MKGITSSRVSPATKRVVSFLKNLNRAAKSLRPSWPDNQISALLVTISRIYERNCRNIHKSAPQHTKFTSLTGYGPSLCYSWRVFSSRGGIFAHHDQNKEPREMRLK